MNFIDCDTIIDGWSYSFGKKWAYAVRGATKKYKLELTHENARLLEKICERNFICGNARTMIIVGAIKERGEEV